MDSVQRFTRERRCPICGGCESDPRGRGERCGGYIGSDGKYIHCSRNDGGGHLQEESGGTFAHRLSGPCKCGVTHGPAPASTNGAHPESGDQRAGARAPTPLRPDWWCPGLPEGAQHDATYDYEGVDGAVAFQVLRYTLPGGDKTFRQRRRTDQGSWAWNAPEPLRELYHLPEILAAEPEDVLFVVEGEKDVDRLRARGYRATTNPLGAGKNKWLPKFSKTLSGRSVMLVPDNDPAGRQHMATIAASLKGQAERVRILYLPGLPEKGDISDWFDAGGSDDRLADLAAAAQQIWPPPDPDELEKAKKATGAPVYEGPKKLRELQQRGLPDLKYIIQTILPEGVTLLAGRPKSGKSFLALNFAISIASGAAALGDLPVERGDVYYLTLEGGEYGLLPRVNTMLAGDLAPEELDYEISFPLLHEGGLERIEEWIRSRPNPKCVIIDTLQKVRPPTNNKQSLYEQDYGVLQSLIEIAQRYHIAILILHHTRKAAADDPMDTISGSLGLIGAVDGGWVLQRVRGEAVATLTGTGRNIPDTELGLEFDPELLTWRHQGTGEEVRRSSERRGILHVFEVEGGGPLTAREVADLMDREYEPIRKMLYRMSTAGELIKDRPKGREQAYRIAYMERKGD